MRLKLVSSICRGKLIDFDTSLCYGYLTESNYSYSINNYMFKPNKIITRGMCETSVPSPIRGVLRQKLWGKLKGRYMFHWKGCDNPLHTDPGVFVVNFQ